MVSYRSYNTEQSAQHPTIGSYVVQNIFPVHRLFVVSHFIAGHLSHMIIKLERKIRPRHLWVSYSKDCYIKTVSHVNVCHSYMLSV